MLVPELRDGPVDGAAQPLGGSLNGFLEPMAFPGPFGRVGDAAESGERVLVTLHRSVSHWEILALLKH